MDTQVVAREFEVCVSMSDLVAAEGADGGTASLKPALAAALSEMGRELDLMAVHEAYFNDDSRAGRGDVHVFEMSGFPECLVAIDLYNDPTDQLDMVTLYFRCRPADTKRVGSLLAEFFSTATCQGAFRQTPKSSALEAAIDSSRFPRAMPGSKAPQLQARHGAA